MKNQWLNENSINSVDKIFIIFPDEGKPYLLVLDDRERPFFFTIDCNTDKLFKSLSFKYQFKNNSEIKPQLKFSNLFIPLKGMDSKGNLAITKVYITSDTYYNITMIWFLL